MEVTLEDTVIPRQTLPNSQDSSISPDPHTEVGTLVFQPPKPVRRTNSINRPHHFVHKNNFRSETCGPCQHRIQFGKLCYKCSECGGVSHPQCKDKLTLPCVPPGKASTKTGPKSSPNHLGTWSLSDHSPESSPMVPAIMVHCILEIERRGLGEIGLYRIPGNRREVKHLRDKFLTGRGCPNLETTDVHVLCGTVKEFLCSLKEPLIPSSLWKTFTSVATNPDSTHAESDLFLAVCELPQPNRDTLAFLILHLQRIAANKETRMNRSNLAKILGPTVIGYSSMDAEPEDIMKEVDIQEVTLERLISIDGEYWNTFLTQTPGDHSPGTPQMIHPSSTLW